MAPAEAGTVQPDGGSGEITTESPPDVEGDDDPVPAVETDPAEGAPPSPSPSPEGASTPPSPSDEETPDDRDVRPDPDPGTQRDEPWPSPGGDTVEETVDTVDDMVGGVIGRLLP